MREIVVKLGKILYEVPIKSLENRFTSWFRFWAMSYYPRESAAALIKIGRLEPV